jgi:hypothetical protein
MGIIEAALMATTFVITGRAVVASEATPVLSGIPFGNTVAAFAAATTDVGSPANKIVNGTDAI